MKSFGTRPSLHERSQSLEVIVGWRPAGSDSERGWMDPQLVDRIYECAFMSDQWPSALGELAAIATARTGFLFVSKGEIHRFVG
jgi:hypothetical protein